MNKQTDKTKNPISIPPLKNHIKDPDINSHSLLIHTSYFPRFGFCFPAKIFNAVDFPIPLVPTNPKTSPGRGIGNLLQYWGGGGRNSLLY